MLNYRSAKLDNCDEESYIEDDYNDENKNTLPTIRIRLKDPRTYIRKYTCCYLRCQTSHPFPTGISPNYKESIMIENGIISSDSSTKF